MGGINHPPNGRFMIGFPTLATSFALLSWSTVTFLDIFLNQLRTRLLQKETPAIVNHSQWHSWLVAWGMLLQSRNMISGYLWHLWSIQALIWCRCFFKKLFQAMFRDHPSSFILKNWARFGGPGSTVSWMEDSHTLFHGYGSIPTRPSLRGMNVHKSQRFLDVNTPGFFQVLTHCHIQILLFFWVRWISLGWDFHLPRENPLCDSSNY